MSPQDLADDFARYLALRRGLSDATCRAYRSDVVSLLLFVTSTESQCDPADLTQLDLRTLLPLDLDTVIASLKKTGRCVVVHEATLTSGYGAELAALVQEHCFFHLEAPVARVTGWDTPYPHAQEWDYFPGPARVGRALLETMEA